MNAEEKEKMLDLLCDKFVYGLSEEEEKQLEALGYDSGEAESIEKTVAALSLVDLESEMPAHLQTKLMAQANEYFNNGHEAATVEETVPQREIVLSGGGGRSWFGWLGWAFAAAASIALAVILFVPRGGDVVVNPPTPTPTPEERLDPAQQRQKLMESTPGQVIMAQWGKGNVPELAGVSGDVVWSDAKQAGYMRLKGLPKNDVSKETYQLWIFDETQDPKTPIDGGTFNVTSDGEVIIPIDAKLKAKNPNAFAITIEKPGGVVVSKREKVAALAPVKQNQV